MPFANDCLDRIGVCPNRLWVVSVPGNSEDLVRIQLIDPLTGELIDLTKYNIFSESSSSSCSVESSTSADPDADCDTCVPRCEPYYGPCPPTQIEQPGPYCSNPNPCWNFPWPIISPPCYSSSCISPTGVELVMKARYEDNVPFSTMQAVIKNAEDAVNGIIYVPFKPCDTRMAGIFVASATIRENGIIKKAIPFYVEVTMDLSNYCPTGPLSIAEIRLATRDVCPAMNFLIDTVEFKDEEIAWALRRPIDYWNEAQPPLNVIYSPITFPFRYNWTEATISVLLRTVALWLRRNDLDYSAGGLTVADTKKWPEYERMATERWEAYKEWVKNKKMELNIAAGFHSIGGYRYNPYR